MVKQVVRALGCVLCVAGCYSYAPVRPGVVPESGDPVALQITDAGRMSLGDRLGYGVLRVEGRLTNASPDYAVNVQRVEFISAPPSRWNGELVRIDRALVGSVWQRKFSRGRTVLAVGAVATAVIAAFVGADLAGFFEGSSSPPNDPPGQVDNRVMRWP
ncbi:MAG: hypothetical protein AB1762_23255 [Gemmatimonadota bacterium]